MTPGNFHDSREWVILLVDDKTAQLGIADRIQRKGRRGDSLAEVERIRNQEIAVTRAGGERSFASD